jgi:uncharacterized protein (TIGR03435 family)
MRNDIKESRSNWRDRILRIAAFVSLTVPGLVGLITAPQMVAQSTSSPSPAILLSPTVSAADELKFEVASIKPNHSGTPGFRFTLPAGRLTATNVTVKRLIAWAYNGNQAGLERRDDQISGGPNWINSERYDIDAKVEDSLVDEEKRVPFNQWADEVRLMVQSLLVDRFKLKVSYQTRELPIYVLVVVRSGAKLAESTGSPVGPLGANPPRPEPQKGPMMGMKQGQVTAIGMPVGALAEVLSRQPELSGHLVVDHTGLKGNYDFTLQWTPEIPDPVLEGASGSQGPASASAPDSSGPSIFSAIQEQLGLKLESQKGPVNVLIIDHVEEPSPN